MITPEKEYGKIKGLVIADLTGSLNKFRKMLPSSFSSLKYKNPISYIHFMYYLVHYFNRNFYY